MGQGGQERAGGGLVAESVLNSHDAMDCSPPGLSVREALPDEKYYGPPLSPSRPGSPGESRELHTGRGVEGLHSRVEEVLR